MAERRHRRSAEQVQSAIREAALEELRERGYAAVTLEGVARRAAVSKPVLYRRYGNRADLIFDAMQSAGARQSPPALTGDLRGDLIAWFGAAAERAMLLGAQTYRGLIGEAGPATLRGAAGIVTSIGARLSEVVLEPARRRGELGPRPLDAEVVAMPLSVLRDRLLFGELTGSVADVVDRVALPVYRAASGAPDPSPTPGDQKRPT